MPVYKTEITSDQISSDNPIHQRLLKPYMVVKDFIGGRVLELGCGEGRGLETIMPIVDHYYGLDKIGEVVERLKLKYPQAIFEKAVFPPMDHLADSSFDHIISFQVIEHVRNDHLFLKEIYRLLKPGGTAIISTPNRKLSLSRNPWHIREYLPEELTALCNSIFDRIEPRGITGNEKVMTYHERNRESVNKIMKYDILKLQYRLPSFLLKIPYEILNRMNRNRLESKEDKLVAAISYDDYQVIDEPDSALDLFYFLYKK